ncbi:UDP-N-acetylglucosamine pyrophosphorylase [Polyrhizophydium stewartii]|uniref:UDP-N-acetylglucosamine diphosphorylase n=1 Tax=Polyrhizophydium stewartii TaxID=2732419 RepID=A0ABR4N7X5_9FUNG
MSGMDAVRARYEAAGQGHVFAFFDSLDPAAQQRLLAAAAAVEVDRAARIFAKATAPAAASASAAADVAPLPPTAVDSTISADPARVRAWRAEGLRLIAAGKVAVILLAGGQGTRLGSSDPKGCYDIGLPSRKSLFQLQGERILRLQQLAAQHAGGKEVVIPWYVMTSGPTRAATEAFFVRKNFFGLKKENVIFFEQGVLPAFTPEGKIFLETKDTLAVAPDGNGGIYAALRSQGVIADLERRCIPYIHAYCVDNCLVKVADPVFIGYCVEKNADCGAKVVPKRYPEEPVGVICMRNGRHGVVEYSEIDPAMARALTPAGVPVYNAGNIANHFYTLDFLRRVEHFEKDLDYHIARKKIKHVDLATGNLVSPSSPNGIKLELFIFDVMPFAERMAVLEVARADEFSPLKNAPGAKDGDSPETSRADIMAQHVRFVEAAGGKVAPTQGSTAPVFEISPLVSYDGEGLEALQGVVVPTPKLISSAADLHALTH